ncbi:YdcF family protein [Pontibacter silvestris]|uniref:YdcF family protein n=1 Tax=Pontibacter silvestris TaxID=2305183 RepID=A0ABW4WSM7_9BACT|nr:YdcF family protein [Pontibacter silvestris]MCC9137800.1 YdcF family protein [Pontibacter silvestris]
MIEELIIRTLCDTAPATSVDGLFLFGQTADNQNAVFTAARHVLVSNIAAKVMFVNTGPISGYLGFDNWKQELRSLGVSESQLEPVPPVPADTELLHTRIEAESLVAHAKKQGYKALLVSASPFQQTRAFMAAVTAALQEYPQLFLYSLPGEALPWQEEVKHSQGAVQGTRAELIAGEMERIRKYHEKGDLASVDEVLDYLTKRDRGLL